MRKRETQFSESEKQSLFMTLSCDMMRTVDEVKMICSMIMTRLLFYFAHQFHKDIIYVTKHMSLLNKKVHSVEVLHISNKINLLVVKFDC